jgi:hypothetical protein
MSTIDRDSSSEQEAGSIILFFPTKLFVVLSSIRQFCITKTLSLSNRSSSHMFYITKDPMFYSYIPHTSAPYPTHHNYPPTQPRNG